jgi:protein tyrosine/serine phosphatase
MRISGYVLAALCSFGTLAEEPAKAERPATWATELKSPGLANFYRISPALLRGAQPDATGFKTLEEMGVKTVVNLRFFHDDGDIKVKDSKLDFKRIHFTPIYPEDADMVKFLKIVNDPSKHPVFVHCQHGSDRTGTMCALYRIAIQGWTKEDAIKEMREGGYGFHEEYFQNLLKYLRNLDIEKIKKKAGIETPAPAVAPAEKK